MNQRDIDEDAYENDVNDMLVSFNENGVIIQRVYAGNKTQSVSPDFITFPFHMMAPTVLLGF